MLSRMVTFYRRNLPHWHPPGQDIFVTWRLKGSLLPHLRAIASKDMPGERFLDLDRALDRCETGPRWLREPRVAQCIVAVSHDIQKQRLIDLHSYAVMANHVHVLLTPVAPMAQITRLVKGATARQANLLLGFAGSYFWQEESFDHWVRNPAEWQKIRTYIERNPVAAGLVARAEDWPWSSASHPLK
jgi:putative transposase